MNILKEDIKPFPAHVVAQEMRVVFEGLFFNQLVGNPGSENSFLFSMYICIAVPPTVELSPPAATAKLSVLKTAIVKTNGCLVHKLLKS